MLKTHREESKCLCIKSYKKSFEWKQAHVGMEPSKTSRTRWEQHHNTFTPSLHLVPFYQLYCIVSARLWQFQCLLYGIWRCFLEGHKVRIMENQSGLQIFARCPLHSLSSVPSTTSFSLLSRSFVPKSLGAARRALIVSHFWARSAIFGDFLFLRLLESSSRTALGIHG